MPTSIRLVSLVPALVLAACASQPSNLEWRDPGLSPQFLKGANVVVACETPDLTLRNICQDQLAADVSSRGGKPVALPPATTLAVAGPVDARLIPDARNVNARAIFVVSLTPVAVDSGPAFSIGLGGFGFGRNSGGGVGIDAPIGPNRVETGFTANGRVIDVAREKVVWSTSAATKPSKDLGGQVADLSSVLTDSAVRAGLF